MGGRRFKSHVGGFACKKGAACKRRVNAPLSHYTSLTPAQGKGHALTNLFASCSTGARPPPLHIHTQIRIAPLRSPHVTGDDGRHALMPKSINQAALKGPPASDALLCVCSVLIYLGARNRRIANGPWSRKAF